MWVKSNRMLPKRVGVVVERHTEGSDSSTFKHVMLMFLCCICVVPTHSGSELRSFRNATAIAALQDEAQLTLNSYIHTR